MRQDMPIPVKVVAFDAKQFQRVKKQWNSQEQKEKTLTVFTSQLGIGVTVPEPKKFIKRYIDVSQELKKEFDLDYSTPFFSSSSLRDYLNTIEMSKFMKRVVSGVQDFIESVHCSFVLLPIAEMPHVKTGGIKCPQETVPTVRFIEKLAPGFSYMTALGYVWRHENADFEGLEMHIDAFSSKHTTAWDIVRNKAPVSVFYRGDECNPFISCADIIASHVDDAISSYRAKLNDTEVKRVLNPYSFDTTVFFFDRNSIPYCTWKMDQMINPSKYLKRPIVYLATDTLTADGLDQQDEPAAVRPKRSQNKIRQSELYQAALKYAYIENDCMKLFNPTEDKAIVRSGDIYIHAGPHSKRMGETLQSMANIRVYSGLEAIRYVEKS